MLLKKEQLTPWKSDGKFREMLLANSESIGGKK